MTIPRSQAAKRFHRCALQRFVEADVLREAEFTNGAVYLAGYAVECGLKALLLDVLPPSKHLATIASFRGLKAHDYEWLRSRYYSNGGPGFTLRANQDFNLVNDDWAIDLRYDPAKAHPEAEAFFCAAKNLLAFFQMRYGT
jgi:hypothetical protein